MSNNIMQGTVMGIGRRKRVLLDPMSLVINGDPTPVNPRDPDDVVRVGPVDGLVKRIKDHFSENDDGIALAEGDTIEFSFTMIVGDGGRLRVLFDELYSVNGVSVVGENAEEATTDEG